MHEITDNVFLRAIFGQYSHFAHITDFFDDPSNIADWRRGACWAGGAAGEYELSTGCNSYFCISLFHRDPATPHRSLRRKALFSSTFCIIADDVAEKLPVEQVAKLPNPSWKLETSPNNFQYGWILDEPATDRGEVENLLDGLVSHGLAPDGKDPGMKGVTRYVRLPGGYNRKAKNLDAQGRGFKCRLIEWQPDRTVSMEDLAAPFGVDLDAPRSETDGTLVDGDGIYLSEHHRALQYLDIQGQIKAGVWSVICPWVDGHTGGDTSGSAVFLLERHAVGFKCHHGGCEGKGWGDVLETLPADWMFEGATGVEPTRSIPPVVRMEVGEVVRFATGVSPEDLAGQRQIIDQSRGMSVLERNAVRNACISSGALTGKAFDQALRESSRVAKEERSRGQNTIEQGNGFRYVFVAENNSFWDLSARVFVGRDGYNGMYGATAMLAEEETPAQQLLQWCPKATRLTYHPGEGSGVTTIRGVEVVNTWTPGFVEPHYESDPRPWLQHVELLVPNKHEREVLIDWMSWTVQNQGMKSNWQILLSGYQGSGKDTLFLPLKRIVGQENLIEIPAERLLEPYEDYLKSKLLIVQEIQNFDNAKVQNKLKRILASTSGGRIPDQISIRNFGSKPIQAPNLVQTIFMSNHRESALQVSKDDRRVFALWSDFRPGDSKEWEQYFTELHKWLHWNGETGQEHPEGYGIEVVCAYLLERDVSEFSPWGQAPETEYKRQLKAHSRTNLEMLIEEAIEDRVGPCRFDLVNSTVLVEWMEKRRHVITTQKKLTLAMSKLGCCVFHDHAKVTGSQKVESHRYWAVRRVDEWRSQSKKQRVDAWVKHGVKHTLFDDEPSATW